MTVYQWAKPLPMSSSNPYYLNDLNKGDKVVNVHSQSIDLTIGKTYTLFDVNRRFGWSGWILNDRGHLHQIKSTGFFRKSINRIDKQKKINLMALKSYKTIKTK